MHARKIFNCWIQNHRWSSILRNAGFPVMIARVTLSHPGWCKARTKNVYRGKMCRNHDAETSVNLRFHNTNGCTSNEGLLIEKAVHARRRLSLFQKPARGSVLPRYHIFARTSQTDRRSNESVITDVARNNENLLVGTVFNSDAIRLGISTRAPPHMCVHAWLEMESCRMTGRMKSTSGRTFGTG